MPDAPLEIDPLLIVLFLIVLLSRLLIDESKKHVGLGKVIQRVSVPGAVGLQHSISL
jgi:hypothetical protein